MARILEAPRLPKPLATFLKPSAIGATWLALAALATGAFFSPGWAAAQPPLHDVVGFACSVAIAGAGAAIAVFGIGNRKMWAIQLALSASLLSAIAALPLGYILWFDPTLLRGRMDYWSFQRLQQDAALGIRSLAGYHLPLGTAVGLAFGAAAGLLIRLGRRRPRLATATALALLFALASEGGRQVAFALVPWLRWRLRNHLVLRSLADDQITITGMIFGAVAGSAVAGLAMYAARPRPGRASTASQSDAEGGSA